MNPSSAPGKMGPHAKGRRKALAFRRAALGTLLVLIMGAAWIHLTREPVYRGKPISQWILEARTSLPPDASHPDNPAREAVFTLAPEAIPYLARAVARKETKIQRGYRQVYTRCPASIQSRLPGPVAFTEIRRQAIRLLGQIAYDGTAPNSAFQPAVPALINAAGDPDTEVSMPALGVLTVIAQRDPSSPALSALIAALDSKTPEIRAHAAYVLAQDKMRPPRALDSLRKRMADDYPKVRINAALGVYRITGDAAQPVQVLHDELKGTNDWLRHEASHALGQIGSAAKSAISALEQSLLDTNPSVQQAARFALEQIAPEKFSRQRSLGALIERLEQGNPDERLDTARRLESLGSSAVPALPALWRTLPLHGDQDGWVIAEAIWKIDPNQASALVAAMTAYIQNRGANNRHIAANLLGRMAVPDPAAVQALTAGLEEKNQWLRQACAFALLKLDAVKAAEEEKMWQTLIDFLQANHDHALRRMSALYFGWLGPRARRVIPDLIAARGDPNESVKKAVAEALNQIGGGRSKNL